jgi:uncharacterized protein with beta-barrel porin domain
MTIAGHLALDPGATTQIYLNPAASTFATVTGSASLGGTVAASFATGGGYVSKQYTILTAAGGLGGTTFSGLTNTDLPASATDSLSYSADDVYLDLMLTYSGLARNQQNAGNALSTYFNTNGGIPAAFFGLSPDALSQVDGEAATGAAQSAFQLTGSFLSLLLDPYAENRGGGFGPAPAGGASLGPLPVTKGPAAPLVFTPSWNVWGAAYGGVGQLSGNSTIGSHETTVSGAAFATGADYHLDPDTMLGFALSGGGTGWSLANGLGSGQGAVFQAGLYGVHQFGQAAYVSGAFAFGDYDIRTHRTIALDGGGMLSGNDNAQSYGGRLEAGYHLFTHPVVLTPYGAVQAVNFEAPGYSEYASAGSPTFALAYNGQSATQTQAEIGSWIDKAMVLPTGMPVDLFGRLAYAHDWQTNPSLGASFLALPGTNFSVEGARLPENLALVTTGATLQLAGNWKLTGKFDGEFAKGAEFYTGTARLQYTW